MYRITHAAIYEYSDSAEVCYNLVRLRPRSLPMQQCCEMQLRVEPSPEIIHEYLDYFGNHVQSFAVYEPHHQLSISAESYVNFVAQETVW